MMFVVEIRFLFLLFVFVTFIFVSRAQNVIQSCVDETTEKKSARLDCGDDGVISAVTVRSGTGHCRDPDVQRCYGLSPPLLVNKLNCFWKKECDIEWPRDPIILLENGGTCVGEKPGFLEISYKCFSPNVVVESNKPHNTNTKGSKFLIDICTNMTKNKSEYELTGRSRLSGIIRSHAFFPWDYNSVPRSCIVNLFWPVDRKLVVSVQTLEVGEGDTLQIGNYSEYDMMTKKRLEFVGNDHHYNTIFNFTVGHYSNGGKGFVVCFNFVNLEDQSDTSACDDIFAEGHISHFSDTKQVSSPDFSDLVRSTTKAPAVKEAQKSAPVVINKKCEKKKTEKKKKRCYDRLKKRGGKKKKKDRSKGKREKSKKKN